MVKDDFDWGGSAVDLIEAGADGEAVDVVQGDQMDGAGQAEFLHLQQLLGTLGGHGRVALFLHKSTHSSCYFQWIWVKISAMPSSIPSMVDSPDRRLCHRCSDSGSSSPGFYEINGATAIPGGVNFTISSHGATSIELLLFHREEEEPFAVLPFPQNYRIGNVYSMIVFKLNIEDFEYAYRVDGPYEPDKGRIFDKSKYLLDPYAKAVTGQSDCSPSSCKASARLLPGSPAFRQTRK